MTSSDRAALNKQFGRVYLCFVVLIVSMAFLFWNITTRMEMLEYAELKRSGWSRTPTLPESPR